MTQPFPMTATAVALTLAAGAVGGPLAQVFDEMALVMALLGGLGGAVRFLALRWSVGRKRGAVAMALDFVAMIAIGAGMAFGIGVLAPPILRGMLDLQLAPDGGAVKALASCGFLIGLVQERVLALVGLGSEK